MLRYTQQANEDLSRILAGLISFRIGNALDPSLSIEHANQIFDDIVDNIERKLKEALNCECVIHMDPMVIDNSISMRMRDFVGVIVANVDPTLRINDFRMVQGTTHTNLIFDLVIPYDFRYSDDEVVDIIQQRVRQLPGDLYAVINVEKPYT